MFRSGSFTEEKTRLRRSQIRKSLFTQSKRRAGIRGLRGWQIATISFLMFTLRNEVFDWMLEHSR
jgi:hypothetical protein